MQPLETKGVQVCRTPGMKHISQQLKPYYKVSPAFKFVTNKLELSDNGSHSVGRTGRKKESKQSEIPHNRKPRSCSFALWEDLG